MQFAVRDLMDRQPPTITPDASVDKAGITLLARRTQELFVIDEVGSLLGLVPDYELLKLYLSGVAAGTTVAAIMSGRPATVGPHDEVIGTALLFRNSYLQRVAVVENERLVGQLRRSDVLWLLGTIERVRAGAAKVTKLETEQSQDGTNRSIAKTGPCEPAIPRPWILQHQLNALGRRRRVGLRERPWY